MTAVTASSNGDSKAAAEDHASFERHSKTFSAAARLLPAAAREDAATTYAFCRLADDIADDDPDPQRAAKRLDGLATELRGLAPTRPLVRRTLEVFARRRVPLRAALDLVAGVRSDLQPQVIVQSDAELMKYAYQVAGTVGLMMHGVLDVPDPRAQRPAVLLGQAMQLTNICRDVVEDALRDRVYLPAHRLRARGVEPAAVIGGVAALSRADEEAVRAVVVDVLHLAERLYARAEAGMGAIPLRSRVAIVAAGRAYRAIGRRILRGASDPLAGRTVVPAHEKASEVATALLTAPFLRW